MKKDKQIFCDIVKYRQGYIEVRPCIHEGSINLEMWNISPDIIISNKKLTDKSIKDSDVTGNTEIELSIESAENLINQIRKAINDVKS